MNFAWMILNMENGEYWINAKGMIKIDIDDFIEKNICDLSPLFLVGCLKYGVDEKFGLEEIKSGDKARILNVLDINYLKVRLSKLKEQILEFSKESIDKKCIK